MAEDEDPPGGLKDERSYRAKPATKGDGEEGGEGKEAGGDKNKDEEDSDDKEKKKPPVWPWIVGGAVAITFVLLVLWIVLAPHARQRTADAYITAHFATVAPRVPGQVASVSVTDNQPVRAGDLLLTLDDRDLRAAQAQAQASLVGDEARVDEARAQLLRQPAMVRQAEGQVAAAQARLALSRADSARFANLAASGAGTVQQHQQADATLKQDRATLEQAQAEREAQVRQTDALRAAVEAARARVLADRAQVEQARLNLSYARVVAPIDGVVDQRQVQVGDYVSPGAAVMTVVPLRAVYVVADFRELALRHMRAGQAARIHLDAYDVDLDGVVDSLPPASGGAYSPIPAANASGNFTKIVQRLPVKVVFRPGQRLAALARVGMSAEVVVDTRLEDIAAEQRRQDGRVVR